MTRTHQRWLALWLVCLTAGSPWISVAAAIAVTIPADHHGHAVSASHDGHADTTAAHGPACHSVCVACAIPVAALSTPFAATATHSQWFVATRIPQVPPPVQERPPRFI